MNPASELAKKRWSKEKPDPEYFKKISKLAAKKRTEEKEKRDSEKQTE